MAWNAVPPSTSQKKKHKCKIHTGQERGTAHASIEL
jgi:hypothetical protein